MIDDDQAFRALADYHLRRFGAEVSVCEDGFEAIKLVVASIKQPECPSPIDAVVVDMRMPRIDGYATATRLRNADYRGRIIAMSASAETEPQQLDGNPAYDILLAKPFDPERLLWAVLGARPL